MTQYRSLENMKKTIYQKYKNQETMKMYYELANNSIISYENLSDFFEKFDIGFSYDEFKALE